MESNQPAPVLQQQGTVRTNCMDNLDRTNVVQAALAKWTMNRQLRALGILSKNESIDDYEALSKDFRESECHSHHELLLLMSRSQSGQTTPI